MANNTKGATNKREGSKKQNLAGDKRRKAIRVSCRPEEETRETLCSLFLARLRCEKSKNVLQLFAATCEHSDGADDSFRIVHTATDALLIEFTQHTMVSKTRVL